MLHTPLAKYLPHVSRLVFGCMGLGGGWNKDAITKAHLKQTHECIDAAIAGGINFFDHADIYTFGKAEQVFGQALAETYKEWLKPTHFCPTNGQFCGQGLS